MFLDHVSLQQLPLFHYITVPQKHQLFLHLYAVSILMSAERIDLYLFIRFNPVISSKKAFCGAGLIL